MGKRKLEEHIAPEIKVNQQAEIIKNKELAKYLSNNYKQFICFVIGENDVAAYAKVAHCPNCEKNMWVEIMKKSPVLREIIAEMFEDISNGKVGEEEEDESN